MNPYGMARTEARVGHYGVHSFRCPTHGEVGFVQTDSRGAMCVKCHEQMLRANALNQSTLADEIEALKARQGGEFAGARIG